MRGQRLEAVHPPIKLGLLRESTGPFAGGEWSREVEAGGRLYRVKLRRGERVRIAFKPAGKNWGHRWVADVWRADTHEGEKSHVWNGEVGKSAGVRGILIAAGVVWTESGWWGAWNRLWLQIGAVSHRLVHPQCGDPDKPRFGRTCDHYGTIEHVCQLTCAEHADLRWGRCERCGAPPPPRKPRQEAV
jgi:hypothetical protein